MGCYILLSLFDFLGRFFFFFLLFIILINLPSDRYSSYYSIYFLLSLLYEYA